MNPSSETILWQEYKSHGKMNVREQLLIKYLPLVKYVAGKMMFSLPTCVDYNDLLSAGVMVSATTMDASRASA